MHHHIIIALTFVAAVGSAKHEVHVRALLDFLVHELDVVLDDGVEHFLRLPRRFHDVVTSCARVVVRVVRTFPSIPLLSKRSGNGNSNEEKYRNKKTQRRSQ